MDDTLYAFVGQRLAPTTHDIGSGMFLHGEYRVPWATRRYISCTCRIMACPTAQNVAYGDTRLRRPIGECGSLSLQGSAAI